MPPTPRTSSPARTGGRAATVTDGTASQRQRFEQRETRKRERAARGEAPRLEEATSIGEALDAEYERGKRTREEELARARRVGFRTGRRVERESSARPPATPRGSSPPAAPAPESRPSSLAMPNLTRGMQKEQGRSLILVFTTLSAIGAITRDVIHGAPPAPAYGPAPSGPLSNPPKNAAESKKMQQWIATHPGQVPHPNRGANDFWNTYARNTWHNAQVTAGSAVKMPTHLRALAGVFIIGTIALVLNEINAELGVTMAGILLLDVALGLVNPGTGGTGGTQHAVFDRVGTAVFNGGPRSSGKGTVLA